MSSPIPETRYAKSGDVSIAYQVVGEGPLDLVYVPPISHLELAWEKRARSQVLERIGFALPLDHVEPARSGHVRSGRGGADARDAHGRHPRHHGCGRVRACRGLRARGAGPLCVVFAATYPERTTALVLMNSSPRFVRNPEFPWLPARAEANSSAEQFDRRWGDRAFFYETFGKANPSASEEEARGVARTLRIAVSPGSAAAYVRMNNTSTFAMCSGHPRPDRDTPAGRRALGRP